MVGVSKNPHMCPTRQSQHVITEATNSQKTAIVVLDSAPLPLTHVHTHMLPEKPAAEQAEKESRDRPRTPASKQAARPLSFRGKPELEGKSSELIGV